MKIVLAIWAGLHPGLDKKPDAMTIATGLVDAVLEESGKAPAFGSHLEDLAVGAVYARFESTVRMVPGHWVDPRTHKAVDPIAFGPWQTHTREGDSAIGYARAWLRLLHDGARLCPESPAAPLSGGCGRAKGLANRRVQKARELLAAAIAAHTSEEVAER